MKVKLFCDRIPKHWIYIFKYLMAKTQKPVVPNGKKAFVFLAADYGNLGDIALTLAQKQMLLKHFPNYTAIEVPSSLSMGELKGYIQCVTKNDIVTIIAGGNMGEVWSWFEVYRQLIVRKVKANLIYQFPQTTTYTETVLGRNLLQSARKLYKGNRLKMMLRENMSYSFARKNFSCLSFLTPDVVMTLKYWGTINRERNGILLCLRDDREKALSNIEQSGIITIIKEFKLSVSVSDTKIEGAFNYSQRYYLLEKYLKKVLMSNVIVTDRLHGMIFAYITGTPAVVLPNSNNKIKMCYEWIKNCGFIHFIPSFSAEIFRTTLKLALLDKVDESILESNYIYFQSIFDDIFKNEK